MIFLKTQENLATIAQAKIGVAKMRKKVLPSLKEPAINGPSPPSRKPYSLFLKTQHTLAAEG